MTARGRGLCGAKIGALLAGASCGWAAMASADVVSNTASAAREAAGVVMGAVQAFNPFATNQGGSLVQTMLKDVSRQAKPAHFESFRLRLDYIHENLYNDYNTRVQRTDEYFGRSLDQMETEVPSRFRFGLFFEVSQADSLELAFRPDFKAEVALPNVQRRWDVVVNTARPGDLPGADPTEINNSIQLGAQATIEKLRAHIGAGIRLTWLPEAYAEFKWNPTWSWEDWQLRPRQSFYYETDEGFGEQTAFSVFRWLGHARRFAVGSITAGTFSESTDGYQWEQTLKGGYIRDLLDERQRGEDVGNADLARGLGLRYSLFGSDTIVTEHRAMIVWRRPIYKQWIYIELDPGLKWRAERDWATDPFILCGLDFLFWGSPTR